MHNNNFLIFIISERVFSDHIFQTWISRNPQPESTSNLPLPVSFFDLNHNFAFASCTNLFFQGLRRLILSDHAVVVKAAAKEEPKWVYCDMESVIESSID